MEHLLRKLMLVAAMVTIAAGCSDSGNPPRPERSARDGGAADRQQPLPTALQAVVNQIVLPKNSTEFVVDLGNGNTNNQLGAILAAISSLPLASYDFQTNIDKMVKNGGFLGLLEVQARSTTDDKQARLQMMLGEDQDSPPDPSDNFSGSESFSIKPTSPPGLILTGSIIAGRLNAGPGKLVGPLPALGGLNPQTVTLAGATMSADVSDKGFANGRLLGGVPYTEVDQKFVPMLAKEANDNYTDPAVAQNVRDALGVAFDLNKDGTITADEVRASTLLKVVLKADYDTDGDKTPDAVSVGMGFSAVPCKIVK